MNKFFKSIFLLLILFQLSNAVFSQQLNSRKKFYDSTECKIKAIYNLASDTVSIGIPIELNTKAKNLQGLFWLCNGQKIDSVSRITYTFKKKGNYIISLVVFDEKCIDTMSRNITVVSGGWSNRARFEGPERCGAVSFIIGNKAYITTGADANNYFKDLWVWNKATNVWTQKADFGGAARAYAIGFAIDSRGYVGTGSNNSNFFSDFWKYNPNTNTWTKLNDFGGNKRSAAVSFVIDEMGYIGLGKDSARLNNDFWKYNPSGDVWTKLRKFASTARSEAIAFSVGNKGYIGCGFDTQNRNDFWEYNPADDSWIQKSKYPGAGRTGMTGFVLKSKAYLGSGFDGNTSKKDFWEFNLNRG